MAKRSCDRTTGVVLRGTESLWTHRWRGLDSNFSYAGAVKLVVAPFDAPGCLGRVGSLSEPAPAIGAPRADTNRGFRVADQYLMRSVTWASSSPTAKAASLNRGRLITARIPFDNA